MEIRCASYYQYLWPKVMQHPSLKMYITPRITASDSPFLKRTNTGLGNVMFQIASCYGLAKITGRTVVWNKLQEFAMQLYTSFSLHHKDTIFRNCTLTVEAPFYQIHDNNVYLYNFHLINILNKYKEPIELFGHLECIKYFDSYRDEIQTLFSPDQSSLNIIRNAFPVLFGTEYTPISIHLRGNEYIRNSDISMPWDYSFYLRAIDYMKQNIPNPIFCIFSDDMDYISDELFSACTPYIKMGHEEDYIDLWSMTLCKHHIVSRSTFSFWGAYLNTNPGKIVLYNLNEAKPYHSRFTPI